MEAPPMSDTNAEATAEPTEGTAVEQGNPADDATLGDAGKKALDAMKAERNKATREAAALKAQLQEIADRDKTETEKLAEKATTSEQRAMDAETRATRLEVILSKLPEDATAADVKRLVTLSKRLVGTTREELEADADELLSTFTVAGGKPATPPDIGQGPRVPAAITDPRAADLAQIEKDLKAGARR